MTAIMMITASKLALFLGFFCELVSNGVSFWK